MSERLYLGIDVGTGSVRAGIFDGEGNRRGTASGDIQIWRPQDDFVEQSSDDIWAAAGAAVREAIEEAGCSPAAVRGIGFDATCSLVALDAEDRPVTVSPTGRDEQNVIVWMDHRAMDQTARINATDHPVLRYVGGQVSPEMQTPKLLWLKENLPETWRARRTLPRSARLPLLSRDRRRHPLALHHGLQVDLSGARGSTVEGSVGRWDDEFFRSVGLAISPKKATSVSAGGCARWASRWVRA